MKTLTGRMLAIAVGNSDLSIEMSHKYREIYAEQGYELPEFNPRGFRPGKKSLPINRLGLPGSELKKSLAWIESLKPATATCSCNNLAAEMDTDGFMKCRERREYYVGRMLENKTAIVEAMKSEGGVNGMLGAVSGPAAKSEGFGSEKFGKNAKRRVRADGRGRGHQRRRAWVDELVATIADKVVGSLIMSN